MLAGKAIKIQPDLSVVVVTPLSTLLPEDLPSKLFLMVNVRK